MIQFSHFHTGGFVLHRVTVGESTYSAWFSDTGRLLGAERTVRGQHATFPVTDRMVHVRSALERIGQRYTREANRLADAEHSAGPLATEFDPVS